MSKEKKDGYFQKFIFSFFGVLIVAFVLYHTFNSLFDPYVTETVAEVSIKDSISANCFIVRKENVITSDNEGYKVFKVSNGGKVAKNSNVVSFYEDANDVELANEILKLESYLSAIEEIDKQNSIHIADLDIISSQTSNSIKEMLLNVYENDFSKTEKTVEALRYYLAQGQLATGREENYKQVISDLKNQLKQLKSKYSSTEKSVKCDCSGYFVNFTDGYENALSYENIEDVTVSQIENLKPAEINKNEVGKVISENEWYLVCVVDTTDISNVSEGDKLRIGTSLSSVNELVVKVEAINKSDNGKKSVLVMSCMKMNEELSTLRQKEMQIVLKTYNGLKVNSRAIRIKDGKKGVYVKLGNIIRFIETEIIYNSKDYIIVDTDYGYNQLKIYDDVVVKGKGLDG